MMPLYITYRVTISEQQYGLNRDSGDAETTICIPLELVDQLQHGNVLDFLAQAALIDWRQKQAGEPEP